MSPEVAFDLDVESYIYIELMHAEVLIMKMKSHSAIPFNTNTLLLNPGHMRHDLRLKKYFHKYTYTKISCLGEKTATSAVDEKRFYDCKIPTNFQMKNVIFFLFSAQNRDRGRVLVTVRTVPIPYWNT